MRLIDADAYIRYCDKNWIPLNVDAVKAQPTIKLSNKEWVDFLSEQFDVSRTTAKSMLHAMMQGKREDNFKKQFCGAHMKGGEDA